MPSLRDLPLEAGRSGLLRWIAQARPHGSRNNDLTVIFDGHPDHFGGNAAGEIRVIFSDGCSADDHIKYMVDNITDRKNCVVVSDDKDVFLYARSLGAQIMTVAAFTSRSAHEIHGKPGRDASGGSNGKYISLSGQEQINKELSSIWLKEKR